MVNNPRFVEAIQAKIGTAVDTEDMKKQIAVLQGQLKQAFGTKSRLERQMDTLDINDAHYDRKILDLQRRYDGMDSRLIFRHLSILRRGDGEAEPPPADGIAG